MTRERGEREREGERSIAGRLAALPPHYSLHKRREGGDSEARATCWRGGARAGARATWRVLIRRSGKNIIFNIIIYSFNIFFVVFKFILSNLQF